MNKQGQRVFKDPKNVSIMIFLKGKEGKVSAYVGTIQCDPEDQVKMAKLAKLKLANAIEKTVEKYRNKGKSFALYGRVVAQPSIELTDYIY